METIEFKQTSLRDFLHIIFKRKSQILIFFAVTVCTVVVGTLVMRPVYEAKAQILVKIGRENLYIPPNSTNSQVVNLNREDQVNSEIELLKSRSLAEKVIKTLGPENIYKNMKYKDAVLTFLKSLSVEGIKKSDVIEVSYKHKDPEMAAKIVNTLANAYLDEHLLVHKNPQSYNFFEDQSQVLKTKLEQSETALETFKKQNAVTAMDEQQKLLLKQIADLNSELNRTLSQDAETKNRILQIRQQLDKTPENIPQGKEVDHNPYLISNLEARLVELQLKEKELLMKYTPQSRLVQNVEEEIQMVQEKLAQNEKKEYGKSSVGLNTTYQRLQEELFRNQADGKALAAKKETQTTQLINCQDKLEQLNQMEVKLNQLEQSVDVNRQNYRLYLAKFEESRISDAMDNKKMANVTLMEAALTPLKPVSPKVLLNIVLGIFLGGFGGLGLSFFTEYLDDSLGKPEHVEKVLQLPVLASIPKLDISDTQAPLKYTPTKTDLTRVKTQSPRSRLAVATMVLIIGGLVFIGYFYIKDTGSLAVKPANSNSEIKGPHSDLVPTNDTKQHAMVAFPDMPKEPVTVSRIDSPDLPTENVEPKIKAEDPKRPDTTVAGTEDEKMSRVTFQNGQTLYRIILRTYGTYNDVILSKVLQANPDIISPTQIYYGQTINLPAVEKHGRVGRAKDHQSLDKTVSVKKDERMNRVVFKNGQTLYRIILRTYGTYNDVILGKVLQANPDIISPTQIHDGQTITLPLDKE
jgi:polysaccharide chain length determinant protein (PEP-CTERM system associated)